MSNTARAFGDRRVALFLALVFGGVTFVGMLVWLPSVASDEAPSVETTAVLVASRDLAAGTTVDADALRVVRVSPTSVAAGALTAPKEVEGRVLRYPVGAGEQILDAKFVGTDAPASSGLAFVIPDGLRAVSVPLSEVTGAGGLIVPGDRVDVLAAVDSQRIDGATPTTADVASPRVVGVITILQDALVLAIGQSLTDGSAVSRDPGTQRADDGVVQPQAASVTLAVSPEQAQVLFMAVTEGTIGLALRPFGETSTGALKPVSTFVAETDPSQVATR